MSTDGIQQQYIPASLDGLVYVDVDGLTVNGVPVDLDNLVPYTNATKNLNLGTFNFETLGGVSAPQHVFTPFTSTLMTGPMTSSIFTADSWGFANSISTVSLSPTVTASYLTLKNLTNNDTVVTFQNDGTANFGNTKVRVSTMASNVYDVVNLSTLQASVAFIENVNALNYVPYNGATDNLNMGASTITTTGLVNAGALRITSSVVNADYTLSVNSSDQLEFTNLSNGSIFKTNGADLFVTGSVNCVTLGATNVEAGTNIYLAKGSIAEWRTMLGMSDEYEILDNAGVMRMRLSKTTGLTVSTMNITQVPSAAPSLALGLNGGGQVVSFAVPSGASFPFTGTTNINGGLQTIQNATQFNPSLDANSYFVTGVSPTTYVFSTNWIVNPVSGTEANVALDPAVFYFDTNHKYIISFTGIYGTGATWVGTVFNNSTSLTVSDASIAITTSPQNLSMTFTAGSSNPAIYLRFVGASGTLRWTNFTIKEVDVEILGNIAFSSEIDSNIVQSNGRTANVAGGLKINQTSLATAPTLTTASLPAGVSASSLSGSYTLTATAGGTTFGMWLGTGFTYTAGAKYTYTFTGFSTNATATQAMILYTNTYTGGVGTSIGDYIVNVPITSSTVSGSFTATSNNNVVWNFVGSASGKSISFTGFTLTRADTEIGGVITATGISSGTPATTIGLNSSNQLIKFTGPVDILPLNNIFTGTNQFNNGVQVAGGNLTCSLGTIAKQTATAGSLVQITGGGATNSPYLEFFFGAGGTSRGYIGNASATDLDLVAQNGVKLNFYTQGTKRLEIQTGGDVVAQTNLKGGSLFVNGGGTYAEGCIYSDVNHGMLFRARVPGASFAFSWYNSVGTQMMAMTNGGVFTAGQSATPVTIGTDGVIKWANPNGSQSHWGYPSGGGSDNYIRGTQTYIDSPIVFNQAISINGSTYPQNTSPYSHVMIYNTSTSAVQRSQCMMKQYFKNENIAWTGGFNYSYAFYKHNAACPVRISGRYSYFVSSPGNTYINLRIYSQSTGAVYYYTFHHYQNFTYGHTTYPLDFVLYGSDLPTGWFDTYIYNAGGSILSDGNDQLQLNVMVLPVDNF